MGDEDWVQEGSGGITSQKRRPLIVKKIETAFSRVFPRQSHQSLMPDGTLASLRSFALGGSGPQKGFGNRQVMGESFRARFRSLMNVRARVASPIRAGPCRGSSRLAKPA